MNIEVFKYCKLTKVTIDCIISMLESVFGSNFDLKDVVHIAAGTAKVTFKIVIKNHGDFLLQIWQEPDLDLTSVEGTDIELLWPGGLERVIRNTVFLDSLGVRVPEIISSTAPGIESPGIAIIEYINGEYFGEMGTEKVSDLMYSKIGDLAGRIHSRTSSKPGIIDEAGKNSFECMDLVHSVILKELFIACKFDSCLKDLQSQIREILDILRNKAPHRQTFNLIHGDGLQMIINRSGDPVLIDIDAMQYFDLEYEYCIMDLPCINHLLSSSAFMDSYHKFFCPGYDYYRLQYYKICKLISWLSYFSEALQKTGNTIIRTRHMNTRQWLMDAIEQVDIKR